MVARTLTLVLAAAVSFALGAAGASQRAARSVGEPDFREYPIPCQISWGCEVALSPVAQQVVVSTAPPTIGTGRFFVSILNYRTNQKPVATLSAEGGPIVWGREFSGLEPFFRYDSSGRWLLNYDGAGLVHIFDLDAHPPMEFRAISLDLSADRPTFQPVDIEWSPDSSRIAVILSFKVFHEGVVRVYDVSSGKMEWQRSFNFVEMGGEAWSPDGKRLAVTLLSGEPYSDYPPRNIPNLLVLNAKSGRTLLIVNTGDQAGPVCFAPDNTLVTAPVHFEPRGRDSAHPEEASVWDALGGNLVRQIASPGRDIHNDLALSADGKVLVAYVGKERAGFSFHAMGYTSNVLDRKFQLFDYKTGNLIATSPELGCAAGWFLPALRISPHGKRVLVYWPNLACAASVFELR